MGGGTAAAVGGARQGRAADGVREEGAAARAAATPRGGGAAPPVNVTRRFRVTHAHWGTLSAFSEGGARGVHGGGGGHIRSAAPSAASLRRLEDAYRSHRAPYSGEVRGTGRGRRRAGRPPWRRRLVHGVADTVATAGLRCGRSALWPPCQRQQVGGAARRQCDSRTSGCESAVRRVGQAAAVVAAAGRWCGHC